MHTPGMSNQDYLIKFKIHPRSYFVEFLTDYWTWEKFWVRGAPGGHTFYVGLSSNSACSLEIPWSEHYLKKKSGKLLKFFCGMKLKKIMVVVHRVCTFFSLDRVQILHTTYKWFENNMTKFFS